VVVGVVAAVVVLAVVVVAAAVGGWWVVVEAAEVVCTGTFMQVNQFHDKIYRVYFLSFC
jgi:hypothetical protein